MTRLLVCGIAALVLAIPANASAAPLIPRSLSSLAQYRHALVKLGPGAIDLSPMVGTIVLLLVAGIVSGIIAG